MSGTNKEIIENSKNIVENLLTITEINSTLTTGIGLLQTCLGTCTNLNEHLLTETIITYADNTSALAGGVEAGQLYVTTTTNIITMCVSA